MNEPVTKRSKKEVIWTELDSCRQALSNSQQLESILRERMDSLEGELSRSSEQTHFSIDRQKRLTDENERLHLILGLLQDLAALDTDRILATTVQKIPYILRARYISVYLYNDERCSLVLKDTNHNRSIDPMIDLNKTNSSLMALAIRTSQTLIVSDVGHYEDSQSKATISFPNRERYGTPSCLVAPILFGDEVLGILNLADRFDGRPFDRADREAVNHVTNFMALSLSNAKKIKQLKASAPLDPLTGLRNHRSFMEMLEVEASRASRYRADLSLIVLNVRSFGWINGNYGHPAGDAILVQLAKVLLENIQQIDILARIGGDEFAVILPEQNINGALETARRLNKTLKEHAFRAGSHNLNLEATLGVVQLNKDLNHVELLRAAENALNEARRKNEDIGVKT
jgi:diguanylate cyclase (GGDEF)-like protein